MMDEGYGISPICLRYEYNGFNGWRQILFLIDGWHGLMLLLLPDALMLSSLS